MKYDGGLNPVQHLQIRQNNNEISRLYMNDDFSKCKNIPHRSKNSLTDFLPTFWFSSRIGMAHCCCKKSGKERNPR